MEFDDISKRMLSSMVSDKLREVDRRGTRMSEMIANGNCGDAIREFTGIVRYQPEWAQFHFDILTYAVRKIPYASDLYEALDTAIANEPKNANLRYMRGMYEQLIGNQRRAIEEYEEALRLHPRFAAVQYNLGNALNISGETDKAITAWKSAIQLSPRFAEPHYVLGAVLLRLKKTREAVEHFKRFNSLAHPHLEPYRQNATTQIRMFS